MPSDVRDEVYPRAHAVRCWKADSLTTRDGARVAVAKSQGCGRIIVVDLMVAGMDVYDKHATLVGCLQCGPQFTVPGPSDNADAISLDWHGYRPSG